MTNYFFWSKRVIYWAAKNGFVELGLFVVHKISRSKWKLYSNAALTFGEKSNFDSWNDRGDGFILVSSGNTLQTQSYQKVILTSKSPAGFLDKAEFRTKGTPSISVWVPSVPVCLLGDVAKSKCKQYSIMKLNSMLNSMRLVTCWISHGWFWCRFPWWRIQSIRCLKQFIVIVAGHFSIVI